MPERSIENNASVNGKKKISTGLKCERMGETFGYRGVYKVANYCSPFFGFKRVVPCLKIRPAMLPRHLDGGLPIACHDDKLRRPIAVMAAKCDNVCLAHSGRKIATYQARVKMG